MELRRRSGLTWELLSDLFNVSRRTIHHWANGKPPSMDNEVSIRRALDAVRHLDEGSQRATRNRLLATVAGQSPFDMLADGRYGEILQMAQGAGASLTFGIRRAALSEDEQARRRPPPPHLLLESIEDRPEIPAEAARIFTPVRAD
ncbi:helix-turn-helix domain-containing protein [Candidatus Foliamicus sp.]